MSPRVTANPLHARAQKNGEIVLEAYDRYSNVLSNFESDSMGKTATAAMVGLLVHKGALLASAAPPKPRGCLIWRPVAPTRQQWLVK